MKGEGAGYEGAGYKAQGELGNEPPEEYMVTSLLVTHSSPNVISES